MNKHIPTYPSLLSEYNAPAVLQLIGALQLYPNNHKCSTMLTELAEMALPYLKKQEPTRYVAWTTMENIFTAIQASDILCPNTFTSNIIYFDGNSIVYSGSLEYGPEILSDLITAVNVVSNKLPEAFKKSVHDATGLLLTLSDFIAGQLNHTRYISPSDEEDYIRFPIYEEGIKIIQALNFTRDEIAILCRPMNLDASVIEEFIVYPGITSNEIESIAGTRPLIRTEEGIAVYMPTSIVESLIAFYFRKADELDCCEELIEAVQKLQWRTATSCFMRMGWFPTKLKLPDNHFAPEFREVVCQIDDQKFGYICYLQKPPKERKSIKNKGNPLSIRNMQVVEFLSNLNSSQKFEVLTIFIDPDFCGDMMHLLERPQEGNFILRFGIHDLFALTHREAVNKLTLWKFAKALHRAGQKVKLFAGGMMEAYAWYHHNQCSLLRTDEVTGIKGVFAVPSFYGRRLLRDFQIKGDRHAIKTKIEKSVGFMHVYKLREYAPIYKIDQPLDELMLAVKAYRAPIWITNNQQTTGQKSNWAHHVCEAIAFWLIRLEHLLSPHLDRIKILEYKIQVVCSEKLLKVDDFIVPKNLPESIELKTIVTKEKIVVKIPFEYLFVVWHPDNRAEKILIKAILQGIVDFLEKNDKLILLSVREIHKMIEATLVPANAKMLLFSDSRSEVQLDIRSLPPIFPIHNADVSKVLEDQIGYLPKDYHIPADIDTIEEKEKIVKDIILVLLEEIKQRLTQLDGAQLLERLLLINEACTQKKKFNEIVLPAKIACFSSLEDEVQELLKEQNNVIATSAALRFLIEVTVSHNQTGKKWSNLDDIGELLVLVDQIRSLGELYDTLANRLDNPKIGLLPSGRLGIDKSFESRVYAPLSNARMQATVLSHVEHFDSHYSESHPKEPSHVFTLSKEEEQIEKAFIAEYGFSREHLNIVIGGLVYVGQERGKSPAVIESKVLVKEVDRVTKKVGKEIIEKVLEFLTLPKRDEINFLTQEGTFDKACIPWRLNRNFSYLRKPIISIKRDNSVFFYYGYRHLLVYWDHLVYLIKNAKLPERNTTEMKSLMGYISWQQGTPFEKDVRNWLKKNSTLEVVPEPVYPEKLSGIKSDKEFGDIDVAAFDHTRKIMYSIECKNSVGSKNVFEMVGEMNSYLGREGSREKSKIQRHVNRDTWLKGHKPLLVKLAPNTDSYTIKSLVLTAAELSIAYLAKEKPPLPIISFPILKRLGADELNKL